MKFTTDFGKMSFGVPTARVCHRSALIYVNDMPQAVKSTFLYM